MTTQDNKTCPDCGRQFGREDGMCELDASYIEENDDGWAVQECLRAQLANEIAAHQADADRWSRFDTESEARIAELEAKVAALEQALLSEAKGHEDSLAEQESDKLRAENERLREALEAVDAWGIRWTEGLDGNVESIKALVRAALADKPEPLDRIDPETGLVFTDDEPVEQSWCLQSELYCNHCGGDAWHSCTGTHYDGEGTRCQTCGYPGTVAVTDDDENATADWRESDDDDARCNLADCDECRPPNGSDDE